MFSGRPGCQLPNRALAMAMAMAAAAAAAIFYALKAAAVPAGAGLSKAQYRPRLLTAINSLLYGTWGVPPPSPTRHCSCLKNTAAGAMDIAKALFGS